LVRNREAGYCKLGQAHASRKTKGKIEVPKIVLGLRPLASSLSVYAPV